MQLTKAAFFAHDWGKTALGDPAGWSSDLHRWVRFILVSAPAMFIVWGKEQTLLFNGAFARHLGSDWRSALGASMPRIWSENWGEIEPLVKRVVAGRSGIVEEKPFRTWASGYKDVRYLTIAYSPLQDAGGELLGGICFVDDRTEEVELRHTVERERDRLHEMFEQAPGFIAMVEGPEHRYVLSNAANRRLLGRDDLIGKTVAEAFPELVGQGIVEVLDRVYATGEPFVARELPFTIEHSPGVLTTHYLDTVYQPVRNARGEITGIFAEGQDVTASREARERIEALQNELIHVSRASAMSAMASVLAHELNQPLTAVANYLAAARRQLGKLDLAKETLAALEWAAEANMRAGEIIRKLRELTLGREATKTSLRLAPVLREAVAFATSGQPEVRVTVDVANVRSIRADKAQIQQVVINLIRNACDAAAGAAVDIRITARMRGAFVEVCVRDDGPGIPGEILPRIFDSFVTGRPGGTGIGLSICRTIIEAHGGNIHARNNPDGGASICFTLPAR